MESVETIPIEKFEYLAFSLPIKPEGFELNKSYQEISVAFASTKGYFGT
jgi:hypothetical protein